MSRKLLVVILRIATFVCAVFPVGQLAIFAIVLIVHGLTSGEYLIHPIAFILYIGGVSGFVGMVLCVLNRYNYFTLALLLHGCLALIIFFRMDLLEFNFFSVSLIFALALCIPNGILCIKNKLGNNE